MLTLFFYTLWEKLLDIPPDEIDSISMHIKFQNKVYSK
jgi:hypothetical protein